MGKPSEAEAECRTALAMGQRQADDNPASAYLRDHLALALNNLGDVARSLGRPAEARGDYERAIALKEPRVREDPADMRHQFVLVCSLRRRGLALRDLGDPVGAAADVRRALAFCAGPQPPLAGDLFETACCHAALAGLAGRAGSGVSAAGGEDESAKAMECLGRAVAIGYRNANELRIESALDPLRNRADFKKLMAELEKNSPGQQEQK
jgi:tetratricopeptide (TPR) repeat protein